MDILTYLDIIKYNEKLYLSKQLSITSFKEINEIIHRKIKDTSKVFLNEQSQKGLKDEMYHLMVHLYTIGVLTDEESRNIRRHYIDGRGTE